MIEYTLPAYEYIKANEISKWLYSHMLPDPTSRRWQIKIDREAQELSVYGRTVPMAGKTIGYTFIFEHDEDYTLFALRWL